MLALLKPFYRDKQRKSPRRKRGAARNVRRPRVERLEGRFLLSGTPYGAMPDDTGEFMLGDVYVTVVLMESADPTENWTPTAIAEVKSRVEEGLQWWTSALAQITDRHTLNFQTDYAYADQPVPTTYNPMEHPSTAAADWIYDFLAQVGFERPPGVNRDWNLVGSDVRAFNHAQRERYGTDWAFTIFVVNDQKKKSFEPGGFDKAFAFAGGRYFVTPADRPASTIAHETGHMFWAMDEYPFGGTYTSRRGYYNTQNTNAWDNPDFSNPATGKTQQPSIMASGSNAGDLLYRAYVANTSSQSSLEMIGWKDSDGDGVFDVLDVPLELSGSGYYDASRSVYRFRGSSSVQTLLNRNPAGLQNDITINKVSRAEYRLDGDAWQTAATYGTYQATLDLAIPVPSTTGQIEIRTVDATTGIASPIFVGDLSRWSSTAQPGIQGFVFGDRDQDGLWGESERGRAGVTVQLLDAAGQSLSARKVVEPDAYASDAVSLTNAAPQITLTAFGTAVMDATVISVPEPGVAGNRVFGNAMKVAEARIPQATWTSNRQLKIEFSTPAKRISLDAIGHSSGGYARLEAYDATGQLIARFTTTALQPGQRQTMVLERPTADIAHAVARGLGSSTVLLDSLKVGPEDLVTTDMLGAFHFPGVDPGTYQIRVLVGAGQTLTSPAVGAHTISLLANGQTVTADFGVWPAASPWQNSLNPYDVNGDGQVTPLDALQILNKLNSEGARALLPSDSAPPYVDVSGDGMLAPADVLLVINEINRQAPLRAGYTSPSAGGAPGAAEGEAALWWNGLRRVERESTWQATEADAVIAAPELPELSARTTARGHNSAPDDRNAWASSTRATALEDVLEERETFPLDLLLSRAAHFV